MTEKLFKKRLVFSGTVTFRADTVTLPNGKKATREFLAHPGAVAVLPILPDGSIIFVRQYRYPVGRATLEIPAGKLHSASDNLLTRIKAELKEETGFTAARITPLTSFWPTPAFSNEVLHIFTACGLRGGTPNPDEDEFLRVETLSFEKAWRLVKTGGIRDSKTVIALQAWKIRLLEKS
ncbi:MAG: hypothetical protein A2234_02575 [Elusimicrobia bacterium RIFOXYA2_FULL_58_8]|nr:MAG: hypothetical protein A2285_04145 [Elusimicrobia bacterium RIFOXYA12_FULL_57_11]OGS13197.1 MAG: hypothetical protein A2234_02575 [Elusimicrobia bacterium RIFOXYA2_FULL_58_8]